MTYYYHIKNKRTGKNSLLSSFEKLEIGSEIGWGKDEKTSDGVAYWTVVDFVCTTEY